MIIFWIGTIAELIKLFPIMKLMEERGEPFQIFATGQNDIMQSELMGHLKTPVSLWLSRSTIKQNAPGLIWWFIRTLFSGFFLARRAFTINRPKIIVVHGDTVSTLMGAILGKLLRARIAHVEAGLRSYNIYSPFPEEICRRLVSNIVNIHFCPNDWAVNNIANHRGIKYCTNGNTLIDSLRYAQLTPMHSPFLQDFDADPYFVFVVHRQENIRNEQLLRKLLELIDLKARDGFACFMLVHEPARIALTSFGLMAKFEKIPNLITSPRLKYLDFMRILVGAQFVVTDGGSNQEECFYLGKPCLILRNATERTEGIGENVLLSGLDTEKIQEFLNYPLKYSRTAQSLDSSPSQIIVDLLMKEVCATYPTGV